MSMGARNGIGRIENEGEIYVCPACGYKDGFHVSFRMTGPKEGQIILICPSCHSRFENGWRVTLEQNG